MNTSTSSDSSAESVKACNEEKMEVSSPEVGKDSCSNGETVNPSTQKTDPAKVNTATKVHDYM